MFGRISFLLFFALSLFIQTGTAAAIKLQNVTVEKTSTSTKIQFKFSSKPQCRLIELSSPLRLVVIINDGNLQTKIPLFNKNELAIKNIRYIKSQGKTLQIVIDLKQNVTYTSSLKKLANGEYQYTLILSNKITQSVPKMMSMPQTRSFTMLTGNEPLRAILTAKTKKSRNLIVIIDPGHGGRDPGAQGKRGIQEKIIVLSIARYLRKSLQAVPGIKAYLTRDRDEYVALRERLSIARKYQADIFIALHADAYKHTSAHGASIFALSQLGATSESARWLAEQENQSELLGGADLSNKDHMLRSVLLDMSQTATINNSLNLGNHILNRLQKFSHLHSKKVEQANFIVLKSPDIPSLLIENGFISNPQEAKNLCNPTYQQKLAREISNGIIAYFQESLPPNTIFSQHYLKNKT